jgi:predicted lipid-binding transport protein (Tim44 family)
MRNFDWGYRIAHLMGEIIEAFIILICVAVLAGLIFLLVRYLLVATRAAQLYVSQHEPPRGTPPWNTGAYAGPNPTSPTAPTAAGSGDAAAPASATGPDSAATTVQLPGATAVSKPTTRGRAPKTPPTA